MDSNETEERQPTILLVDDSPLNLGVIVSNLEAQGYNVLVAIDGEEALERIAMTAPDLILLDAMLPGLDGFEVCRRLQANPQTADIPVIFLTSLGGIQDKVKGFEAGAVDYITKPLQIGEVRIRIGTHLKLRSLQKTLEAKNRVLEAKNRELHTEIVERKRLEETLAAREREFRSLAENVPDNIARWDTAGRYLYINPTHELLLGVSAPEIIGQKIPDEHEHIKTIIAQVAATGQPALSVRQPVRVGSGEMQYHEVSLVPERDGEGRVVSVLGIGRDMTDIYRMQEALAAREQEFRSLAESSPDFIVRYDRDGKHRYLNTSLVNLLELNCAEEVIGKRPAEVWPDGRFDQIERAAEQAVESGCTKIIELVAPRETGELDYNHIVVVPERDVAGNIIGTIAFGRDVTAIRESELRLKHFIDSLPGIAFAFKVAADGRWSFPYISPAIHDFYGLQPEDVRDDAAPLHALAHPEDQPRIEAIIAEARRAVLPLRFDLRVCRAGMPERWLEVSSDPEPQADGSIIWYGIMLDITGRKQAEQALKKSEANYRYHFNLLQSIFESSPKVAIYALDRDYRYLSFNNLAREGSKRLWGADIAVGMSMLDDAIDNDAHREFCKRGFDEVLAGRSFSIESREEIVKNGKIEYEYHENHGSPIFNDDGDVIGLTVFATNITDRKRIEEQLRLKEFALDRARDAVYLIDDDLRFIYVNEEACRSLGYSRDELSELCLFDIDPDLTPEGELEIEDRLEKKGAVTFESRNRRRDGSSFPVEVRTSAFEYQGQVLGVSLVRDITERKRIEDELRLKEFALDQAHEAAYLIDDPGQPFIYVNEAACRSLGYSRDELLALCLSDIDPYLTPEDALAGEERLMTEGSAVIESRHRRRDGSSFPVEVQTSAFEYQGRKLGLALVRDITERKQAEQTLEELHIQLRGLIAQREAAREEERKHIARELHDDLGQLMTALRLNVQMLASKIGDSAPSVREHLRETVGVVNEAQSVVRNLSKSLRPIELDMGIVRALEWAVKRFETFANIGCRLHIGHPDIRPGELREIALFRIAQESFTNIAKHAQATEVEVSFYEEANDYVLKIRDNGKGFDTSEKKANSFGLIGIRERVLMLAGTVSIDSGHGNGTEITVRIPVGEKL